MILACSGTEPGDDRVARSPVISLPTPHATHPRRTLRHVYFTGHRRRHLAFDVVIRGGTVVDGTGAPPVRADIGITGERITAVGDIPASSSDSARTIDASGLHISPGFIDVHAHSDGALLSDGQHASGIRQGVTTEIIAPDGLTLAPLSAENYRLYRWYLSGILGLPPEGLDMLTGPR